jgi:hypothetical protein
VKDSNLRSFRDGFADLERQAREQRKRPSPDNFHAYSPKQPPKVGYNGPRPAEVGDAPMAKADTLYTGYATTDHSGDLWSSPTRTDRL